MDTIHIGTCTFLPDSGELKSSSGTEILQPQTAKVFYQLATQQNQIVSRNALIDAAWPNQIVSDESLTHAICAIRKTLKNNGCGLKIETLHKRGYRLQCKCKLAETQSLRPLFIGGAFSTCALLISLSLWLG